LFREFIAEWMAEHGAVGATVVAFRTGQPIEDLLPALQQVLSG
jgi:hypothetical protein